MPTWNAAARLDGLPVTNWKRRTGYTLDGTLAQCIARWLDLPDHQRQGCSLGWREGRRWGSMEPADIAGYVVSAGLPPHVAERIGGQPSREKLKAMVVPAPLQAHIEPARGSGAAHVFDGMKKGNDG